jgi:hypothetical protein
MAVVTQSGNLVWQKVKNYLSAVNPILAAGTNPPTGQPGCTAASSNAFQDLRMYLSQQKRNPDLQFIPFTAEDLILATNAGTTYITGAGTLYAAFVRGRRTSATTSAYINAFDNTANSGVTLFSTFINLTGFEATLLWPTGTTKFATGLTMDSATAVGGGTVTTAVLAADGFVIVGV